MKKIKFEKLGNLRIRKSDGRLFETAAYFSAYEVSDDLIDPLEAFAIRLMPNNVVNTKMEKAKQKKKK